jgi:prokaryotic ubiquitin-like protein Pup
MIQKQKQVSPPAKETEETQSSAAAHNDKLDEDVGDILDEIDAVLEPNAEAFVKGYQQKGGQ